MTDEEMAEEYADRTETKDWEGFDITREVRKQAFLAGLKAEKGCETCTKFDEVKLTQAKEIIKTLADDLSMYSGSYQKELLQAEQFLKE